MDTQTIKNQVAPAAANENSKASQRLDFLFSHLPSHVYDWLFSEQAAANIAMLAKKFSLTDGQKTELARLTGLAILKDISLAALALELKKSLSLDDSVVRQLAIATALKQFLPIRDHLLGTEDFIRQLGGLLPSPLPPLFKASSANNYQPAAPAPPAPAPTVAVAQKTLRQLAQDNKEALNQNLTANPIKIADFDQPARPTIKNWLVDYVKIKGAGHHASLERSDYLFNSPNAKSLPEKERALVAEILRAYDDELTLPVSELDQSILLERLSAPEIIQMPKPAEPQPAPQYRESISQEDLSPKRSAPAKPAPRLSGNIIDLKDLE